MLVVLVGGCQSRSFEHGDAPQDAGTSATFGSFGAVVGGVTGEFSSGGNYPEPAVTRCGEVPGDTLPIEGLASAWGIVAVPGATANQDPIAAGSVLLRISEQAIRFCGDAPEPISLGGSGSSTGPTGTGARGVELLLGPEELTLGVHEITALEDPRVVVYGDGAVSASAAEGRIELLHVDDDCIIGVVRDFVSDTGEPFMPGGFVAQTCQQQCIPSKGNAC
ncbi:MAG: hypothetical protein KUG77_12695 [Nannocystaceae bacterium]|nr:hypothetical protein [Nannocystaceae bacterium]